MTRAQIETVLVRRTGAWLSQSGLDSTTVDGTNTDLADAIAAAILQCDSTVADITNPTSAEIQAVDSLTKFLDVAELRLLENILENLSKVDSKAGAVEAKLDQLAQRIERAIARKREQLAARYGLETAATLETGVINLGFQQIINTSYIP